MRVLVSRWNSTGGEKTIEVGNRENNATTKPVEGQTTGIDRP
jgi:hypothetical protein